MPNLKNAVKKVKVIAKKSESNNTFKASMRTAIKKVEKAVEAKDKANASELLKDAIKKIDKAVSKGVIHKNTGARYKARLTKKVNAME
ncbi:MAG: 30S ribosomal protein S20 [Mollicutes bacterium]|nr:30S ribosomal protein S20 [Mollicutes bacterium]